MRRLLSAFAGQYLGAAIGGVLTVFFFLTKRWDHIDVVFYLVVPLIILSATGAGFYIGGSSQSHRERPASIRALVGLAGAFVGMIVTASTLGCVLLIAYFVIGHPPVSATHENIGVLALVLGSVVGALGGFVITRGA